MISDYSALVWKILSGIPIEVFDEDTQDTWSEDLWELVSPRDTGDYSGSRLIGSANIITAHNLLHLKLIASGQKIDSLGQFRLCLDELVSAKLIRKRPERLRETFKTVS